MGVMWMVKVMWAGELMRGRHNGVGVCVCVWEGGSRWKRYGWHHLWQGEISEFCLCGKGYIEVYIDVGMMCACYEMGHMEYGGTAVFVASYSYLGVVQLAVSVEPLQSLMWSNVICSVGSFFDVIHLYLLNLFIP